MSSLLGILSGLGDILGKVFGGLFSWFVETFIVPIVQGAIEAIIMVVKYTASTFLLEISQFLLGLIDFVEVLFRALAGLPSTSSSISITMSLNGKTGDLLINMLTSTEVVQAFYATAIVGMFLLIITTIFQMIKVEYTTEGAQNSKSGIIGKSLKSLCNMLIIPILCILGVFIGNQVLDLIDTATGGGTGNKISGQLWVAAASSAMVKENTFILAADGDWDNEDKVRGGLLGLGVGLGIANGMNGMLATMFGYDYEEVALGEPITDIERGVQEAKYLSGALSYYDNVDIVKYYNPFEINYLVLIFGACIIIKCLYYTCFGLIDRLYQCVALFIVMPMVVGMSPVKDSLGSWRGKFMQKALSAYGTVISINLFFIIVKVLLNINISITGTANAGIFRIFTGSFMEGLIKSIMVIVGCLMIEKLAGDLGGYFGAGNAMAEGKGLSKDATAGVTKAATLAVGVAAGGASLAMKGAKAAGGIAGKIGGGIGHMATGIGKNHANRSLNATMNKNGITDTDLGKYSDTKTAIARQEAKKASAIEENKQAAKDITAADKILNSKTASRSEKIAAQKAKNDAENRMANSKKDASDASDRIADLKNTLTTMDSGNDGLAKAYKMQEKSASRTASYDAYNKERAETKAKNKDLRKAQVTKFKEGSRQLFENKFGAEAMFNTFAPKSLQNLRKDYNSAVKTAMDASPEGQAMMGTIDKAKKDEAEATFNKRNAGAIEARNLQQVELILSTTNAKLAVTNKETNQQLDKMNKQLEEWIAKMKRAETTEEKSMYASRIGSLQQAMMEKNSNIKFNDELRVVNKDELKVDFKMDSEFMKKITEQVKKGVKMDDIMTQISEEFKKIGLTDKDTLAKIYKALEELKGSVGGK